MMVIISSVLVDHVLLAANHEAPRTYICIMGKKHVIGSNTVTSGIRKYDVGPCLTLAKAVDI